MPFVNECFFRTVAGGTADFVVASAVPGFYTPAQCTTPAIVNGGLYFYRAETDDFTQYESGLGVYTTATATLARTTIYQSSNSGAKVNFTRTPRVLLTIYSQYFDSLPNFAGAQTWAATQTFAPLTNVSAVVVNAHDGGNSYATRNIAQKITTGTKLYDVGLSIKRGHHDTYSLLDIDSSTVALAGGKEMRFFHTSGGVRAMSSYFLVGGAYYTALAVVISGTKNNNIVNDGEDTTITPPTLDPAMLGIWADTLICQESRCGNIANAYVYKNSDRNGVVSMTIEENGSLRFGPGDPTGVIGTGVGSGNVYSARAAVANLDVGLSRKDANTLEINNTVKGTYRDLQAASFFASGAYVLGTGVAGYWNNAGLGFARNQDVNVGVYWNATNASGAADARFWSPAAASFRFGAADAAAPVAQTLSVQNVATGTTNTAGVDFTIAGSQGTGTGVGGSLLFKVAPAGGTGSTQNALATALAIDSTKFATFAAGIDASATGMRLGSSSNKIAIDGIGWVGIYQGGVENAAFTGVDMALRSDGVVKWSSGVIGTGIDAAIGRNGVGIIEINSSVLGTLRDLKLRDLYSGANKVVTARQTGWGVPTGTLSRLALAAYAGQTVSAGYVQAEAQATDNAVKAASQTLAALITDLITHGLIGA